MSYDTILVPLDGSDFSKQALPLALSIARRCGAALRLVQVHVAYPIIYGYEAATFGVEADVALVQSEQRDLLWMAGQVRDLSNLPTTATMVRNAAPVEGLVAVARQCKAGLIVMTTHGRGPVSTFWLGSVADEMLRTAPCPVLTSRPVEGPVDLGTDRTFKRILVPLDGSNKSEYAVETAVATGSLMDAEYHLLHVCPSADGLEAAEAYLRGIQERMRPLATAVTTHAVTGPHVPERILEVADQVEADLLVLETHGRRGLERWRLGSVADKLLRRSPIPVLTARTPVRGAAEQPKVEAARTRA